MAENYTDQELLDVTQIAYYNFDSEMIEDLTRKNGGRPPDLQQILVADYAKYKAIDKNLIEGDVKDTIYGSVCVEDPKFENVEGGEEKAYDLSKVASAQERYEAIKDGDRCEGWTLLDYHNENASTGFVACVLDPGDGGAIIGFRGSESDPKYQIFTDWVVSDVGLSNSYETVQQHAAEAYVEDMYKRFGDKYDHWAMSGHSLGGALAAHGALTAPQEMWENITQAYSLDGPGVSDEYIAGHRDYIERMRQHPDVMRHYGWSWVGDLIYPLPCMNYQWLDVADDMNGLSFFETTRKHDTCSVLFNEDGSFKTANKDLDWFAFGASAVSKGIDAISAVSGNASKGAAQLASVMEKLDDYFRAQKEAKADAQLQEFISEHDFENEQQIRDYLQEHTQNGNLEYLVRGALLRCRHGTHARRLNLTKCHGVYITTHPVIHAANCISGLNITYFGICNSPAPPNTETVHYTKDVPRDSSGNPCGDAPGGFESGKKCCPEIVGEVWLDTYPQTRIVDNGDIDGGDRAIAESGRGQPKGRNAVTTLSFLICKYGGLIEPYNSGQQYDSDEEELKNAEENVELDHEAEENTMHEIGGEGDAHGEAIEQSPVVFNGRELSEETGYLIDSMRPTSFDGDSASYDWHNIEYLLNSDPEAMTRDKYDALCYVFNSMESPEDMERFINLGYTTKEIPKIEMPRGSLNMMDSYNTLNAQNQQRASTSGYRLCAPNSILGAVVQWYCNEKEGGTLSGECAQSAAIMEAISESGKDVYVPVSKSETPIKIALDESGDFQVTLPMQTPENRTHTVTVGAVKEK